MAVSEKTEETARLVAVGTKSDDGFPLAARMAEYVAGLPREERREAWEKICGNAAESVIGEIVSGMGRPLKDYVVMHWAQELRERQDGYVELVVLRWLWANLHRFVPEPDAWFWALQLRMREAGACDTWWVEIESGE